MRCVVYSNFGGDYFEKSIRPKLEAIGLDIVKVILPHKETEFSLDFDLLVGFQDMTVKSQRDAMRAASRKHGKPTIFLSKSNPSWEKEISDKMSGFQAPAEAAPAAPAAPERREIARIAGVPKDKVGVMLAEYVRAAEADEDLSSVFREALGRDMSGIEEAETIISSVLASGDCPAFFKEWWASRGPQEDPPEEEPVARADEEQMSRLYMEENALLREENAALRSELELVRAAAKVDSASSVLEDKMKALVAELSNVRQEISAIRDLRESGSMSDSESLKLLLTIAADA